MTDHLRPIEGVTDPSWGSGDRVLVAKFPYDNGHSARAAPVRRGRLQVPRRAPQKGQTPMNYIKRLCGLPGRDDRHLQRRPVRRRTIVYPDEQPPRPDNPKDLWQKEYTYSNDEAGEDAFNAGKFKILRKPPDLILAMRRLVYDNDHQPADLAGKVAAAVARTMTLGGDRPERPESVPPGRRKRRGDAVAALPAPAIDRATPAPRSAGQTAAGG